MQQVSIIKNLKARSTYIHIPNWIDNELELKKGEKIWIRLEGKKSSSRGKNQNQIQNRGRKNMKMPKLKSSTIDEVKKLYTKHREIIEYNAMAGNKVDKGIALTIKQIVGEDFIKSCRNEEKCIS